jgi:hypothetical protein
MSTLEIEQLVLRHAKTPRTAVVCGLASYAALQQREEEDDRD